MNGLTRCSIHVKMCPAITHWVWNWSHGDFFEILYKLQEKTVHQHFSFSEVWTYVGSILAPCSSSDLNFCAELKIWWKCYIFLHLSPIWPNYHTFVSLAINKVSIQQHCKSRLFWKTKTKFQEAENLCKSSDGIVLIYYRWLLIPIKQT